MSSKQPHRLAIATLAACSLVLVACSGGQGSDADPDQPRSTSSSIVVPTSVTFLSEEAHANLPTEPGCDQVAFHSTMAMFDPSLADELVELGCPFPYEPTTISMEGGVEDPTIAAPFEPRRYLEVFEILDRLRFGVCTVGRLNEPSVRGFVYGFTAALQPQSCADSDPSVAVVIREYASRAHRDEAANTERPQRTLVLGRFIITIAASADDEDLIAEALRAVGAAEASAR